MKVRSSYPPFLKAADDYFTETIGQIQDLQFTNGDGPIIAFQVENEFGAFGVLNNSRDTEYMIHLRDKMIDLGVQELFFTSDTPGTYGQLGTIPGVLQTGNLQTAWNIIFNYWSFKWDTSSRYIRRSIKYPILYKNNIYCAF